MVSYLFIVGLFPQVVNNFALGRYMSGSLGTWGLYTFTYFAFGLYMWAVKERWVALGQAVGGTLCVIIVLQSLVLPHAQ